MPAFSHVSSIVVVAYAGHHSTATMSFVWCTKYVRIAVQLKSPCSYMLCVVNSCGLGRQPAGGAVALELCTSAHDCLYHIICMSHCVLLHPHSSCIAEDILTGSAALSRKDVYMPASM